MRGRSMTELSGRQARPGRSRTTERQKNTVRETERQTDRENSRGSFALSTRLAVMSPTCCSFCVSSNVIGAERRLGLFSRKPLVVERYICQNAISPGALRAVGTIKALCSYTCSATMLALPTRVSAMIEFLTYTHASITLGPGYVYALRRGRAKQTDREKNG